MSTNKERFLSLVSKEEPDTLKRNKWRIKNRWWLRHYQRIDLWFLVTKDKIFGE